MNIPMDAIVSLWAFCPCNVTGKQPLSLEEEFRKRGIRVDVYSADLQPTLMQNRAHRHHVGDYKEAYEILLKAYGKPPVVVLGNPVCHYSTFVCPGNHFKLGGLTVRDKKRLEEKREWLKNKFEMLHIPGCPVIITENPKGYADKVITFADGGYAYVEVQPYQFLGFAGNWDPNDNHVKATHLFSAGNQDAIGMYPIEAYIVQHEEPVGCVHGWVGKQKDSDARSVVPTGMADALSKCAVDRYTHSLKQTTPKELVRFAFHEDKINSSEALEKRPCNTRIGMFNGKECFCNLPLGHDTDRNIKRGVTCCAYVDYTTGQTLFSASPPSGKRPSKYRASAQNGSNEADQAPNVKPLPVQPSTEIFGADDDNAVDTSIDLKLNECCANSNDVHQMHKLVTKGANLKSTNGDPWYHTPLHQACYHNRPLMVDALLKIGAYKSCADLPSNPMGCKGTGTPIELAEGCGHVEVARLLKQYDQASRAVPPPVVPRVPPRIQYGGKPPSYQLRCEQLDRDTDDSDGDDGLDDNAPPQPVLAVRVYEQTPSSATQFTVGPVLATPVKTQVRSINGVRLPLPKSKVRTNRSDKSMVHTNRSGKSKVGTSRSGKSKVGTSRSGKKMRRFRRTAIKKIKLASNKYATLGKYVMEAAHAEKLCCDLLKLF